MQRVKSQMQAAFMSTFGNLDPTVTSVMHGEHVKDSAHYQGRAVDVGALGGTIVGFNKPTWDALVRAITSRQYQKIGTIGQLADNPQLQALAQANGVELFDDPGSGNHIHLQVGP